MAYQKKRDPEAEIEENIFSHNRRRQGGGDGPQPAREPGIAVPALNEDEQKQVTRRTAPRAAVVYEAIRREGEDELRRPSSALFWSGLAAGLSMGFSFVAESLLRAGLPDTPARPLIAKLGYSVGFLIVILGRQQLFTENTLTPILPLLQEKSLKAFLNVLRLWAVVLLANLV